MSVFMPSTQSSSTPYPIIGYKKENGKLYKIILRDDRITVKQGKKVLYTYKL